MSKNKQWTRDELVKIFEMLIERGCPITSHPQFRKLLDRDENLFANQVTREANGNIAYRSVDFEVEGMEDAEFWEKIDSTPYNDLIEDNAAIAILKMAEKFNLVN